MGQVIRLTSLPPGYPTTATALDAAEGLLLGAIRWWASAFRRAEDPLPHLLDVMDAAGVEEAALSVDGLMAVLARTARRPVDIHCPRCPDLSEDERRLLHAASLTQANEAALAERVLRTALLTAQGAECALVPLEGLGRILATAGLLFRRDAECWAPVSTERRH
jgi:hypothetical protein